MTVSIGCNWKYYLFFNGPLKFGSYCLGLPVTKQNVLMKYWHCYCNSPLAVYKLYCRMCLFTVFQYEISCTKDTLWWHIFPSVSAVKYFGINNNSSFLEVILLFTDLPTNPSTHQLFYPPTLLPTLQSIHRPIHSIHSPTYPLIEDQSINQLIHPYINTSTYSPTL